MRAALRRRDSTPYDLAPVATHLLCPLSFEARILSKGLRGTTHLPGATVVGPGLGPKTFIERHGASGDIAILVGTAGAIRTPYPPAAWLARVESSDHAGGGVWRSPLLERVLGANGAKGGAEGGAAAGGLTVSGVVRTPAEKAALAQRHPDATLIDLESWGFAETCHHRGVQWLVLRGVSDGPNDTLPVDVADWVTPRGSTRLRGVLSALIREPQQLPAMRELGVRSTRAMLAVAELLGGAAEAIAQLAGRTEGPREHDDVPLRLDQLPSIGGEDD